MEFIDSHTHLYLPEFDNDRDEVISRALDNNVSRMLLPNIDAGTIDDIIKLSGKYPGICYPMTGLHPTSVNSEFEDQLQAVKDSLSKHIFIAIGEIGIDLYWDKTYFREQEKAFREQINIAVREDLPVVIHSRESIDEIIEIIDDENPEGLKGVFHSFTGTADQAKKIVERGFYIGTGGIMTFKNSGLDSVIKDIDIEKILLETDSPYLAPVPKRGKRNESSYVRYIADKLANIKGLTVKEVAGITTNNCKNLFNLE